MVMSYLYKRESLTVMDAFGNGYNAQEEAMRKYREQNDAILVRRAEMDHLADLAHVGREALRVVIDHKVEVHSLSPKHQQALQILR